MLPREVKFCRNVVPWGEVEGTLSGLTDLILRCINTYLFLPGDDYNIQVSVVHVSKNQIGIIFNKVFFFFLAVVTSIICFGIQGYG